MSTTTKTTIRVTTAPGTNASLIGEAYAGHDGVSWRSSVDRCDSDGCGRVFLDCDSDADFDEICKLLQDDAEITQYEMI
jgi:hypothetical protein